MIEFLTSKGSPILFMKELYGARWPRAHASPSLHSTEKEWTRADMPSSNSTADHLSSSSSEASTSGSVAYIEHTVTRLDTLAGVAIKYGVEVADVKRFNGLTTDLQMFALKTLRIPTPGRHPPSALLISPTLSRYEKFTPNSRKHKAVEKTQDTSTMELLRDYYALPSMSVREDLEMATLSFDKATDLHDEAFLPMFRPPNTTDSRRHSTGDYRTNRCGYVRESCNNLLEYSCWSVKAPESSHVMKSTKGGDSQSKDLRPIRRRTKGDLGSERVNFQRRSDPDPVPLASSGINSFGAALLEGKGVIEGLLSKVMLTGPQEGTRPLSERVPSTGSLSVLEGITSVYRHAKAALD